MQLSLNFVIVLLLDRPLDMLEEATIKVHYEQGTKAPLRQKRYLSNPLRKMLNRVDWNASFISNIPFNEVGSKVSTICFHVAKRNCSVVMRFAFFVEIKLIAEFLEYAT